MMEPYAGGVAIYGDPESYVEFREVPCEALTGAPRGATGRHPEGSPRSAHRVVSSIRREFEANAAC